METLKVAAHTSRGILFNNDCLDVLRSLATGTVDTFFADPPFNLGKFYGNGLRDRRSQDDYLRWCYSWLDEAVRVLVEGGSLFVYNLPQWNVYLSHYLMTQKGLDFRHWIAVSMKNGFARAKRLQPVHYALIYLTKGEPGKFNADAVRYPIPLCRHCHKPIPDWGGHVSHLNPKGVNLPDVWSDLSPVRHKSKKKRPFGINELPVTMAERVVLLTTGPGDLVVDPFGGCGSTYETADRNGRYWIGCEIADCSPVIGQLGSSKGVDWEPTDLPGRITELFGAVPIQRVSVSTTVVN